jgi:mono/diheme cytochrome c family protein
VNTRVVALLALALAGACRGKEQAATAGATPGAAATAATASAPTDPRAAIFVTKGCPQCHSIAALGVKSPAEVGPDLALAYEDVQNRFGMELEQFLVNPTGTMQVVLSSAIQLSPAERDSVIRILRELHEARAAQSTKQ